MARKTHQQDHETLENIRYRMEIQLDPMVRRFLEVEAKRLSKKLGRPGLHPNDIVRALIASYYEKRMAGLLVDPDD